MDFDNVFEGLKENKKTLIVVLVLFIAMIVISISNLVLGNSSSDINMKKVVTSFAQIYYEEYYYPELKSTYADDYYNKLEEVENEGIKLTLNKIVNTFEEVNATKFYEEGNYCDFANTYAVIYPQKPYNIDNYKIEVNVSCEKKLEY